MVYVQLDLDENENRIVRQCMLDNSIVDKRDAIKYIVREYKKNE